MANEHEYEGIEYHSDGYGRERHAACNVKFYGDRFVNLGEEQAMADFGEQAWENVRESFWEEATDLAHDAGYSCVFQEGRSGGWLVPFRQMGMHPDERTSRNLRVSPKSREYVLIPLFHSWPGQGGRLGYPRYPDMDEIGERSRFRAFAKRIEGMMEGVPQMIQDEAEELAEEAVEAFA